MIMNAASSQINKNSTQFAHFAESKEMFRPGQAKSKSFPYWLEALLCKGLTPVVKTTKTKKSLETVMLTSVYGSKHEKPDNA